jgi:hypothetical protein
MSRPCYPLPPSRVYSLRRLHENFILLLLVAVASAPLLAQDSPKTPAAKPAAPKLAEEKPIAQLSWLIGGVWTADASAMGDGMQRIETRYTWSDNNAFLRFNTHFVAQQGTLKQYDGQFFFDPEKSALAMWYMNPKNGITQGPITVDGDTTTLSFRGPDFEGKVADLRVLVLRKSNDHYVWQLEEKSQDTWKPLAKLDYLRTS